MILAGLFDAGFTGYDWLMEGVHNDPRLIVLARRTGKIESQSGTAKICVIEGKRKRSNAILTVGSPYPNIASEYFTSKSMSHLMIEIDSSTEGYVEHFDYLVDVVQTGETAKANGCKILDTIMETDSIFICNKDKMSNPILLETKRVLAKSGWKEVANG